VVIEQHLDDAARPLRARDAREQAVAGVGGADRAPLLVAVERERERAQLLAPERVLEPRALLLGLGVERCGLIEAPERAGEHGRRAARRIDVTLHLAQRDRARRAQATALPPRR
jgi:hypothetical protein